MDNYKFYVFTYNGIKDDLTLQDVIKEYKETETGIAYKALGVTKDNTYSCDLLNNLGENNSLRISQDYKSLEHFKDDSLITVNTIKILQREFNL